MEGAGGVFPYISYIGGYVSPHRVGFLPLRVLKTGITIQNRSN